MKQSSIRAFGIALFLVGAFYAVTEQFDVNLEPLGIKTTIKASADEAKNITKLNNDLQTANKKIQSLEAQLSESANAPAINEPSETKTTDKQGDNKQTITESNKNTTKDKTYTLQIYRNITTATISQKLEEAGIIQNAIELELFLAKDEYARSIQIGEYQLNSKMTIKEIADTITKNDK